MEWLFVGLRARLVVEGFFESESEVGSREFQLRLFLTSSIASLQNAVKTGWYDTGCTYVCMYVYSIMAMHHLGYGPLQSAN